jgi:Fur family peroxide stress response transcriptional regulator
MLKNIFKSYYYLIIGMNGSKKSDESIIEALRRKGYKATPQRIAICRFVLGNREHPTAQRIYGEVKKVHPTVSLATVYQTLQILKELDLVQELGFPGGQTRFDSYMEPHINLVCLQCGNVMDLDDSTVREIIARVIKAAKFTATGQRLDIYGICQECRRKKAAHSP